MLHCFAVAASAVRAGGRPCFFCFIRSVTLVDDPAAPLLHLQHRPELVDDPTALLLLLYLVGRPGGWPASLLRRQLCPIGRTGGQPRFAAASSAIPSWLRWWTTPLRYFGNYKTSSRTGGRPCFPASLLRIYLASAELGNALLVMHRLHMIRLRQSHRWLLAAAFFALINTFISVIP